MKDTWSLVDSFFDKYSLVDHHIKSYNDFINNRIQEIIDITEPITLEEGNYTVRTGKVKVYPPFAKEADGSDSEIFPKEARLRNLTYPAHLKLEMALDTEEDEHEFELVPIGEIPLMVKSDHCYLKGLNSEELIEVGEDPLDAGGYFIVNGSERAIVTMEDIAPNKDIFELILRNKYDIRNQENYIKQGFRTKVAVKAEVNSIHHGFKAKIIVKYKNATKNNVFLRVSFPYLTGEIPLVILLRALGLSTDEKIITKISSAKFDYQMVIADDIQFANEGLKLEPKVMESLNAEEKEEYLQKVAIKYIGNRVAKGMAEEYRINRAENIIDRYLLPHIGIEPDKRERKAVYLAEMAEKILQVVFGDREIHDTNKERYSKDHYANKRLRVTGDLMEDLFRLAFNSLTKDISYQLNRSISRGKEPSIKQATRADVLTDNIKHAIATGNWVGGKSGVSQLIERTSYMGTLSHLRRVVSTLTGRISTISTSSVEARDLHPTQFGKICPNETPEGSNCGLVKNLALMCKISEGSDTNEIIDAIKEIGIVE